MWQLLVHNYQLISLVLSLDRETQKIPGCIQHFLHQPSNPVEYYIKIPGWCNPQNIPATVAAHSQVSSKSENLGKSIQVCFMAQNVGIVNFRASSLLSVITACTSTS